MKTFSQFCEEVSSSEQAQQHSNFVMLKLIEELHLLTKLKQINRILKQINRRLKHLKRMLDLKYMRINFVKLVLNMMKETLPLSNKIII